MAELNLDEIAARARAAAERADKATGMDAEGYAFQASSVDVPALAADVTALLAALAERDAEVARLRAESAHSRFVQE